MNLLSSRSMQSSIISWIGHTMFLIQAFVCEVKKGGVSMSGKLGHYAFLAGVILAVLAGVVPGLWSVKVIWVLMALGVLVGLLNITAKETLEFLVAISTLVITSGGASVLLKQSLMASIVVGNILAFAAPAGFIVAVKTIWQLEAD